MKSSIVGLIAIANVLTFAPSLAQTSQTVNGCGPSGILGHAVPDRIRILNCELRKACNSHDTCYAKCLPGGALFNNPTCEDGQARYERRRKCDADLGKMIIAANKNRRRCVAAAAIYEGVVRMFGNLFFQGYGLPGQDEPIKEELYRVPLKSLQGKYLPTDDILKRNYDAVEAFLEYAERTPSKLSEAEIDAALASVAEHYPPPSYVLEFRSSPAGAEFVVVRLSPEQRAGEPREEKVIWQRGA